MRPITKDAAFAADTIDRNKNISNMVLVALCFINMNNFIHKNIKYVPDNKAIMLLFYEIIKENRPIAMAAGRFNCDERIFIVCL